MPYPLLAKDLTERAAHLRTYVVRALFGVLLAAWFRWFMFRQGDVSATTDPSAAGLALMGIGREIFTQLSYLLCWALLLVQPALMASALTHEKERGTMDLLLLTPTRPWSLLVQKYFAGLLPMATLLLFALPLGAIAYSYGGVSPELFIGVGLVLLGTWLQTGAAALLCSAWFRTTPAAMIASYTLLAVMYFAGSAELRSRPEPFDDSAYLPIAVKAQTSSDYPIWRSYRLAVRTMFPPAMILNVLARDGSTLDDAPGRFTSFGRSVAPTTLNGMLRLAPALEVSSLAITTILFLLAARVFLLRRSRVTLPIGPRLFAWLDAGFRRIYAALGGAPLPLQRTVFLTEHPVFWRESTTGILGRPRHLLKISAALAMVGGLLAWRFRDSGELVMRTMLLLGGAMLIVRSVEAIAGERQRQTLEVLLTTPVPRSDIVRHKARALFSLAVALMAPVVLLFVVHQYSAESWGLDGWILTAPSEKLLAAFITLCSMVLAFRELCWLGFWCGLAVRSRTKATLVALGAAFAWIQIPQIIAHLLDSPGESHATNFLMLLPPDGLLSLASRNSLSILANFASTNPTPAFIFKATALVLVIHFTIGSVLRQLCLRHAERLLLRS